ncbi:DUF6979 family protein [Massilia sp. GCM10020059]|uniref:DUF6979 family protein n=1 Tax=Massilia TaxID=149698 RepID=UPI003530FCF4
MPDYADVAVRAALKLRSGPISPREAWDDAAVEVFPESASMQSKGCPRTTFLTLCASGAVKDLPGAGVVGDSENARHAKDCLALLAGHPGYVAMPPRQLWTVVTHASGKAYNQQMHVILGLAKAGLLRFGEHLQT